MLQAEDGIVHTFLLHLQQRAPATTQTNGPGGSLTKHCSHPWLPLHLLQIACSIGALTHKKDLKVHSLHEMGMGKMLALATFLGCPLDDAAVLCYNRVRMNLKGRG